MIQNLKKGLSLVLKNLSKLYNDNASVIWRFLRGTLATAAANVFTEAFIMKLDLTKPKEAMGTVIIALASGFLLALSKAIRDKYGETHPLVNKLFI